MLLYFEFEEKRRKGEVTWPKDDGDIIVHIIDKELAIDLPTDLYFTIEDNNKVDFTIEDQQNKRLLELQHVIRRRLQEFVNKR